MRPISIIPFEIFSDIWYTYISGEDGVSYTRMDAPPSYAFQLPPLNKPYRGTLVRSITLKPFEIY